MLAISCMPLELLHNIMEMSDPVVFAGICTLWREIYRANVCKVQLDENWHTDANLKLYMAIIKTLNIDSQLTPVVFSGAILILVKASDVQISALAAALPQLRVVFHSAHKAFNTCIFQFIKELCGRNSAVQLHLSTLFQKQSQASLAMVAEHTTHLNILFHGNAVPKLLTE
jgi:hypothetical protein